MPEDSSRVPPRYRRNRGSSGLRRFRCRGGRSSRDLLPWPCRDVRDRSDRPGEEPRRSRHRRCRPAPRTRQCSASHCGRHQAPGHRRDRACGRCKEGRASTEERRGRSPERSRHNGHHSTCRSDTRRTGDRDGNGNGSFSCASRSACNLGACRRSAGRRETARSDRNQGRALFRSQE